MSYIEQLTNSLATNPNDIDKVVDEVLHSDFNSETAFREFQTAERAVGGLFKVLTSKRSVVQSTFNKFDTWHPLQYDLFDPIILSGNSQIVCYPIYVYDEARSISRKMDELKAHVVRPVTHSSEREYGYRSGVNEKWRGYLLSPEVINLAQGENSLPMALEDVTQDYTTYTRSNPGNWLTSFTIDDAMRENQARFKQFTEELLAHEGHQQVATWQ